ncbi:MAG TPA: sulfotransferase [Gemmatimonadales bacterium]|nr:sulfotransferase [Gemmatimonadales bacterium]
MTPPFFIVGFQRSGTTLLRMMLDSHPDVAVPLDTVGMWARYAERIAEYGDLGDESNLRRLVADLLAEERIRLWQTALSPDDVLARRSGDSLPGVMEGFYRAYAAAHGKRLWGDKDPGNMTRLHLLDRWFPGCRFVHIIRDGRDACLSQLEQDFGFDDPLACAECWREQVWWVRRIGQILGPARYHELRYEDLVAEPEARLRALCRFLGIEFAPGMLEYHARVDRSIPASKRHIWKLIDQPPRADNAERWRSRMPRGMRVAFEKRAGAVLRELGYDTLPGRPSGAYLAELGNLIGRGWRAVRRRIH